VEGKWRADGARWRQPRWRAGGGATGARTEEGVSVEGGGGATVQFPASACRTALIRCVVLKISFTGASRDRGRPRTNQPGGERQGQTLALWAAVQQD
jgi:hypothetical protein